MRQESTIHNSKMSESSLLGRDERKAVATIGTFDGVHRGHRCLLGQVRNIADERGLKAVAITFATAPRLVLDAGATRASLTTTAERVALLREVGMDDVALLTFTPDMALLTAREFMQQVLHEQLGVAVLVIGYDHRFGYGRTEGFDDYVRYGKELGIEVLRGEACMDDGEAVSSTRIRRCIAEGHVSEANNFLGYNYMLEGRVVDGYKVGRKIGFPTANIQVDDTVKLLPADGVYAVYVNIIDSDGVKENDNCLPEGNDFNLLSFNFQLRHVGMLNIGHRPTVNNGEERSIEVHILDFAGDLYGQVLRIEFVERLRDEQTFGSLGALMEQLRDDEQRVRNLKIEN